MTPAPAEMERLVDEFLRGKTPQELLRDAVTEAADAGCVDLARPFVEMALLVARMAISQGIAAGAGEIIRAVNEGRSTEDAVRDMDFGATVARVMTSEVAAVRKWRT